MIPSAVLKGWIERMRRLTVSLGVHGGMLSRAERIRSDKREAVLEKLARELPHDATEEMVKNWLALHEKHHPEIFVPVQEASADVRVNAYDKQNTTPSSDYTKEAIAAMTPTEKLNLIYSGAPNKKVRL